MNVYIQAGSFNKIKYDIEVWYTGFIEVVREVQTEMDLESVQHCFLFSYTELRPEMS